MAGHKSSAKFEIAIIGGGLVGMTASAALAASGKKVCMIAPKSKQADTRTTAIMAKSVEFLKKIEIWEKLEAKAHPLKIMRIIDATDRLIRSPQTDFRASEIDLPAFGYNVRNDAILGKLDEVLDTHNALSRFHGAVTRLEKADNGYSIFIDENGTEICIEAEFLVGADGRNSIVRAHTGLGERQWTYEQKAIVVDFKHEHPSQFTSTEFHTSTGPFTIVPRENRLAGLVWLEKPHEAERIISLPGDELAKLLEQKMHSFLGKIEIACEPQTFPVAGMIAKRFGVGNCALIGEAAHVFPPIGAQGFNLGIRDIETLVDIVEKQEFDYGTPYHAARISDITSRTMGVDFLNKSLLSEFLPSHLLKGMGMFALHNITPLRKFAMKSGISPHL